MSEREAAHLGVGESSPGSREAEGEGGEGFHIALSGKYADLPCMLPPKTGEGNLNGPG